MQKILTTVMILLGVGAAFMVVPKSYTAAVPDQPSSSSGPGLEDRNLPPATKVGEAPSQADLELEAALDMIGSGREVPVGEIPINSYPASTGSSAPVKELPTTSPALVKEDSLSPERLKVLDQALRKGDFSSLQVLREEYLEKLSDYDLSVLPALKATALDELLIRFSEQDWRAWSDSTSDAAAVKSNARRFVDDVYSVNTELGIYLETASHLLHRLYDKTSKGKPFSAESELEDLLDNAERIMAARTSSATPAVYLLSSVILGDRTFVSMLESKRCQIVSDFIQQQQGFTQEQLYLLPDLKRSLCSEKASIAIQDLIGRVALTSSAELRKTVLRDESVRKAFANFSHESQAMKGLVGDLYVLAAVDALESGDEFGAEKFLRKSVEIAPGLLSQGLVQNYLKSIQQKTSESLEEGAESKLLEEDSEQGGESEIKEDEEIEEESQLAAEEEFSEEPEEANWVFSAMLSIFSLVFVIGLGLFILKKFSDRQSNVSANYDDLDMPDNFEDDDFWENSDFDEESSEYETELGEVNKK